MFHILKLKIEWNETQKSVTDNPIWCSCNTFKATKENKQHQIFGQNFYSVNTKIYKIDKCDLLFCANK